MFVALIPLGPLFMLRTLELPFLAVSAYMSPVILASACGSPSFFCDLVLSLSFFQHSTLFVLVIWLRPVARLHSSSPLDLRDVFACHFRLQRRPCRCCFPRSSSFCKPSSCRCGQSLPAESSGFGFGLWLNSVTWFRLFVFSHLIL